MPRSRLPYDPSEHNPEMAAAPAKKKRGEANYRFKLVAFENIKLRTDPGYLIKGVLPREGVACIWGPPKCGKTFAVLDLAMHVALGRPYRGRKVHQGPVVYVACEGERGLGARVAAWRQNRLNGHAGPVPFHLVTTRLRLPADAAALIADIRAQLGDVRPILIVIDTLNRSIEGSESSDEDMTGYIGAMDRIREAFGGLVCTIHHCGIEASRPRGHTSLTGAVDCQARVTKDSTGLVTLEVQYMKDGPEGETFASRLKVVDVGTDDEGDTISSCVIEEADGQAPAPADRASRLSDQAQIALQELRNLISEAGEDAPASTRIPRSKKVVRIDLFRTAFGQATGQSRTKPDSQRRAFQRQIDALKSRGLIGVWGDFVWLAGQPGQVRTDPDMFNGPSRTTPDTPL